MQMKYDHEGENRGRCFDLHELSGPERLGAYSGAGITAEFAEQLSHTVFGISVKFAVSISCEPIDTQV